MGFWDSAGKLAKDVAKDALDNVWTAPKTVDKFCPHDEARSKACGLTPPR